MDCYERDYPRLKAACPAYPAPDALRAVTAQGAVDIAPYRGFSAPTQGSDLIIRAARRDDPRPLYLLMWGLLEDLAQALHDAPDILPKLRVHYIGGPNKKWGPNAYAYLRENFPGLWMIENNATYRGWFNGGDQTAPWDNAGFVTAFAKGRGALGDFFASQLGGSIKMGDTPTVAWLLHGDPENPQADSWGGRFVPMRHMPEANFKGPTTLKDAVEVFSILRLGFSGPVLPPTDKPVFELTMGGQRFDGYCTGPGQYQIRLSPKETGDFAYTLHSAIEALDGLTGSFRVVPPKPETHQSGNLTHWWSDILDPNLAEGPHLGARTVSQWRRAFLADFAERLARCAP